MSKSYQTEIEIYYWTTSWLDIWLKRFGITFIEKGFVIEVKVQPSTSLNLIWVKKKKELCSLVRCWKNLSYTPTFSVNGFSVKITIHRTSLPNLHYPIIWSHSITLKLSNPFFSYVALASVYLCLTFSSFNPFATTTPSHGHPFATATTPDMASSHSVAPVTLSPPPLLLTLLALLVWHRSPFCHHHYARHGLVS